MSMIYMDKYVFSENEHVFFMYDIDGMFFQRYHRFNNTNTKNFTVNGNILKNIFTFML